MASRGVVVSCALALAAVSIACTTAELHDAADGGADASTTSDATTGGPEASADGASDAGTPDAPPWTCAQSLEAGCAPGPGALDPECVYDLASAEPPPSQWCNGSNAFELFATCDGFTRIERTNFDSDYLYYYAPDGGALVAVAVTGNGGFQCLGGVPDFVLPEKLVDGGCPKDPRKDLCARDAALE